MLKHIFNYRRYFFLYVAIITMLIQSFVISTAIKGLLLPYVFILAQFSLDLVRKMLNRKTLNIFSYIIVFLFSFILWQLLAQLFNAIYQPVFYKFPTAILLSPENPSVSIFRNSMLTQSMYLLTCVIFFLYLLKHMQTANSAEMIIKIARLGIIIFVIYGFVEYIGYFITGHSIDVISNRITGVDYEYSKTQLITLGGIIIPRIKSLTSEPSVFGFSVLPFAILFYYMKDKIYILLLIAALLSTSTGVVIGILIFAIIEAVLFRKIIKLGIILMAVIAFISIVDISIIYDFYRFTYLKLSLQHVSGINRFENLYNSLAFFFNSDVSHFLFGYGFGYIRSVDGFSTLLVNIGLVGFLAYTAFFTYPLTKLKYDSDYKKGLLVSNIVLMMMTYISVTEFYCFHIWFLAALTWYEFLKERSHAQIGTCKQMQWA